MVAARATMVSAREGMAASRAAKVSAQEEMPAAQAQSALVQYGLLLGKDLRALTKIILFLSNH